MARLADEVTTQIKQDISLLRVTESHGVKLKKQGKDYIGHCPFHDDKTPSFIISPATNLWHCLGACNEGGSVIDFVMKIQGLSFRAAVDSLSQDFLPLAADSSMAVEDGLINPVDDQALFQRVITYYHETLKQHPEAQAYLKKRGLDDVELITTFKLGYANRSLGTKLPEKNRKAGAEIRSQLERIGLYRTTGHEHFNGSLVIPVVNDNGQITEVYGRKLLDNLRKGTPKHLYLPGVHDGVFNPSAFSGSEVILCESLIDALTFWRWGFKHVTTSYGVSGFTDDVFNAFKQGAIERVLIAYDRDEAGNNAAEKLAKVLMAEGIDCYRVLFPKGMDANSYALQVTPARKSLELVLRNAEWMGKGAAPQAIDQEPQDSILPLAAAVELPASPQPASQPLEIPVEVTDTETVISLENRRYRIRGLQKAMSYEQLKINLCVSDDSGQLYIDHIDLYHAKQRYSFIKQASIELGVTDEVIKKDLAKLLLKLEQLQDEQIQAALTPKEEVPVLSNEDQQAALELLNDKHLLDRILDDFNRAGVVGEETNKLVGYLAAVSRKLDSPLAVIIQSTSAAGKSSLMNAVLAMMPEEERIQYSAMTGQSLFYMGETNLKHKILAIAEEEGAEQASYALKLLQSEGELTIASTGKDADGNLTTQEYHVEGPVMLFSTTTAIDIDEELMNRCVVLTVNESREQTRLIHALQRERETLQGLLAKEGRQAILQLHRNAQRLLKPLRIVNPYATQLTFMDSQTRSRRDHMKYLQLIKAITLLHQYQRDIKTVQHNGEALDYIEVTLLDIETANGLAHDILGRSLNELPPQNHYRFSRRDIREHTGWSDNQLKVHCRRLEELEYLLVHQGSRGKSIAYELLFVGDVDEESPRLMGLIDMDSLKKGGYDHQTLGGNRGKLVPSCPQVGAKLAPSWSTEKPENTGYTVSNADINKTNEKRTSPPEKLSSSCRTPAVLPLAANATETL